jgi:regulator of sigma E protease
VIPLTIIPEMKPVETIAGIARVGVIGVQTSLEPKNWYFRQFGLLDAAVTGVRQTWLIVADTGLYVKKLFLGEESADQMSGPLGIAELSGKLVRLGLSPLLDLVAGLSVSVGLMNLLPIPILDGGHLIYLAIEFVRGRAVGEKAQELGLRAGLVVVFVTMIVATLHDLVRLTGL